MLTTLNGMFCEPKPHRINFIKENKKKLKVIASMVYQSNIKSRIDVTGTRGSQTEVTRSTSESSATWKENRHKSMSRLSSKGSVAAFLQERKGDISNVSLSSKKTSSQNLKAKNSQKLNNFKNQSSQTIDPRRCDQLFHEGVIKYPSNKVMQELAEMERQRANRLDAHIKKEYFKRNKVRQKSSKTLTKPKPHVKRNGKGDDIEEVHTSSSSEEKEEEEEKQKEPKPEPEPEPESEPEPVQKVTKPPAQPVMRAAEIIKKATEDINSTKTKTHLEFSQYNKTETKQGKKGGKKLTREEEILKTVLDPQCPPGHIPLPDSERKKTLHMLRVSHAELVREMNLLPVRTDTLRVRQKKIQLENQLNKIEEGIKVFNKSKVYVKIEE